MFSYVQIKVSVGLTTWCVFYNCALCLFDLFFYFFLIDLKICTEHLKKYMC